MPNAAAARHHEACLGLPAWSPPNARAARRLLQMLAAGGLAHIVQRLTDIHDAAFDSELLDEEVCRGLAKASVELVWKTP